MEIMVYSLLSRIYIINRGASSLVVPEVLKAQHPVLNMCVHHGCIRYADYPWHRCFTLGSEICVLSVSFESLGVA